jgi:hypothetical protein
MTGMDYGYGDSGVPGEVAGQTTRHRSSSDDDASTPDAEFVRPPSSQAGPGMDTATARPS